MLLYVSPLTTELLTRLSCLSLSSSLIAQPVAKLPKAAKSPDSVFFFDDGGGSNVGNICKSSAAPSKAC